MTHTSRNFSANQFLIALLALAAAEAEASGLSSCERGTGDIGDPVPYVEIDQEMFSTAYLTQADVCRKNLAAGLDRTRCAKAVEEVRSALFAYLENARAACKALAACGSMSAGEQQLGCRARAYRQAAASQRAAAASLERLLSQADGLKAEVSAARRQVAAQSPEAAREQEHAYQAVEVGSRFASTNRGALLAGAKSADQIAAALEQQARKAGSLSAPEERRAAETLDRWRYEPLYPTAPQMAAMAPQGGGSGGGGSSLPSSAGSSMAMPPSGQGGAKLPEALTAKLPGVKEELAKLFPEENQLAQGGALQPAKAVALGAGPISVAAVPEPRKTAAGSTSVAAASRSPASEGGAGAVVASASTAGGKHALGEGSPRPGLEDSGESRVVGSAGRGGSKDGLSALDSLEALDKAKAAGTAGNLAKKLPELPKGNSDAELNAGAAGLVGLKPEELGKPGASSGAAEGGLFARVHAANQRALLRGRLDDSKSIVMEHLTRMAGSP